MAPRALDSFFSFGWRDEVTQSAKKTAAGVEIQHKHTVETTYFCLSSLEHFAI